MNNCQYRNSSLKTRLSDLQKMVSELTVAQREYEDYAHKLEQTTKYILIVITLRIYNYIYSCRFKGLMVIACY